MSAPPGFLARNWQLKLSALGLAVLLWTVPRFEAQSRQVLEDVPVRIQLNDPQWALRGEPLPATVRVALSGPARDLFALTVDRPSIVVPVDQVSTLDTAVLLRSSWLRLPGREGVLVESIEPSTVRLAFEPMEVAALPLAPRVTGSLPPGLALAAPPKVTPPLVRISGPASRVAELDSLRLLPVELSRLQGSTVLTLPLDTAGLGGIAISPSAASVELQVEEAHERALEEIAVVVPTLPADPQLQVRPTHVSVILTGARSRVEGVNPLALQAVVPSSRVLGLAPGEERRVTVEVLGLPTLVRARLLPEWVVVRRPPDS